jgi:colicin import membrane protein
MPPRSKSVNSGGWRPIALSVLLHSAIVAAAVYSWFTWKHRPPETALAVEATLVDERTLKGASTIPAPAPPPPEPVKEPVPEPAPAPVEDQGPPKPDPAEIERKQEEDRLAAEKLEQQKQAQEKREQAKKEEERQAQELKERETAERLAAEKQAAAKAAASLSGPIQPRKIASGIFVFSSSIIGPVPAKASTAPGQRRRMPARTPGRSRRPF